MREGGPLALLVAVCLWGCTSDPDSPGAPHAAAVQPAAASEVAAPPPSAPAGRAAGPAMATCTFDVRELPIDRVLSYVRKAAGDMLIVVAAEAVEERITLQVRDLPWRSALEEIARQGGCAVEERPEYLRVVRVPDAVGPLTGTCTFDVRDEPIDRVVDLVRKAARDVPIEVPTLAMEARVTLKVRRAPWRDVLGRIADRAGCVVEEHADRLRIAMVPGVALESLQRQFEKCRIEGESYREGEQRRDFLRMAASKRDLRTGVQRLEECLREVSRQSPEFADPDLQRRFVAGVTEPLGRLRTGFAEVLGASFFPLRVVNLSPGATLRYPVPILRGEAPDDDGAPVRVVNLASKRPDREMEVKVLGHRFLALVDLVPGENEVLVAAPSGETRLRLRFDPPTTPWVIRFVYLVDSSGDTAYQSERPGDPQDFAAKLDTAAKLLQSVTAERMNDEGYGRRTFALELGEDGRVQVHLVKAPRDAAYYRGRTGGELFGEFSGLLEGILPTRRARNIVLMAFTRFNPRTRQAEAHTALGGGGLALFGSAGMFSWPSRIADVPAAFSDTTRVDSSRTHDDSNGRGTYWGLAATTLGAVLHETGHTLRLPHSTDPLDVMTRGFDHINRAFTVIEPPSARGGAPDRFRDDQVMGFGRISSPRLAWNRFFQPDAKEWKDGPPPTARLDRASGKVVVEAPLGLRVVGINRPDGRGILSADSLVWPGEAPTRVELDPADLRRRSGGWGFMLQPVDDEGNWGEVDFADRTAFVRTWRFDPGTVPWPGPPSFPALPAGGVAAAVESLRRQPAVVVEDPHIDLLPRYPEKEDRAARALAVLRSDRAAPVRIRTGSDDALRVWLNGDLVLERPVLRAAAPDQDAADATLREGENTVLVEVANARGDWGFYLRFEDPSEAPWTVADDGTLRAPAGR